MKDNRNSKVNKSKVASGSIRIRRLKLGDMLSFKEKYRNCDSITADVTQLTSSMKHPIEQSRMECVERHAEVIDINENDLQKRRTLDVSENLLASKEVKACSESFSSDNSEYDILEDVLLIIEDDDL
mmetsp:Transcript_15015/g.23073  ORF Transcript_15015/g.23073 Transcript_15015/m.23073 type:complete len:127 (+) Transcript_15015:60-440(+)